MVSLGFGLGVYFRIGMFPPHPPSPAVNFAMTDVCRLSVCSGFGTSGLAYFGVDLARVCVDWAFLPGSLCLILLLLLYMYDLNLDLNFAMDISSLCSSVKRYLIVFNDSYS